MKSLFTPEGEAALAALAPRRALLAFDFDGTLAPIVARPERAQVPLAVTQRLARLAARRPVAILSGRRVEDIRARLDFEPRYVVGSHGAEDPERAPPADGERVLDPARARLHDAADALRAAGVWVEDKGYSIALHYRLAPDLAAAAATIDRVLAGLGDELRVFGGKRVANLVPAAAADKADALFALMARAGAEVALFVGDDVNDEPVFARAPADWVTVRIERDARSQARYFVPSIRELPLLLDRLLAAS